MTYDLSTRRTVVLSLNEMTISKASELFDISTASIKRWKALFDKGESLVPKPKSGRPPKLEGDDFALIKNIIDNESDITYRSLHAQFNELTGRNASYAVIVRAVLSLGYTFKKK